MEQETAYLKFRGKCKEMSEALIADDPTLTLVRGHYFCPYWGEQPHWWTKKQDGTIIDPTREQFPSCGTGIYIEFDGIIPCSNCGKEMREDIDDIDYESRYAFCGIKCHGQFVGVF